MLRWRKKEVSARCSFAGIDQFVLRDYGPRKCGEYGDGYFACENTREPRHRCGVPLLLATRHFRPQSLTVHPITRLIGFYHRRESH